jgi:hypothetical protein
MGMPETMRVKLMNVDGECVTVISIDSFYVENNRFCYNDHWYVYDPSTGSAVHEYTTLFSQQLYDAIKSGEVSPDEIKSTQRRLWARQHRVLHELFEEKTCPGAS